MKKELLGVSMGVVMAVTSLAGCGSTSDTGSSDAKNTSQSASEDNNDLYTMKLCYAVISDVPADEAEVEAKVNEITEKEIGVTVDMEAIAISNLANTYTLHASGGEKMDLLVMLPGGELMNTFASTKLIQPLDDLLDQYGQGIKESMDKVLMAGEVDGTLYGIPSIEAVYESVCSIEMSKEIVDKYNIDISNIHTLDDLDDIFAEVHEKEPDLTIFYPNQYTEKMTPTDKLGDGFGVLANQGLDDLTVENQYEDENWINIMKKMREWYEAGYISKDAITAQDAGDVQLKNGSLFSYIGTYAPDQDNNYDDPQYVYDIPLDEMKSVVTTSTMQTVLWGIANSCERPDKAMQFLNLMYTNADLVTLLQRGIEGKHYNTLEDGTIEFVPMTESGYFNPLGIMGNKGLLAPAKSYGPNYKERIQEAVDETVFSKAYGFTFDSSPVKSEVAALNQVKDEYYTALECGTLDLSTAIDEFNDRLYAAGLQKVIDEKQSQLSAWAETVGQSE